MNRLALKIKEARMAVGLSEKDLAKKCGLSVGYIIQVESGKKIVNESVAEKILKSLGVKEAFVDEERPAEEPQEKPSKKVEAPKPKETVIVEPSQSWADALSGVIKKYPVVDLHSNKTVDYKELPIISKKIEGHHPDKIMFVKASNNDMAAFRIEKDDVLTVFMTKEIQNDGLYLFEIEGKKMIRQLRKEANNIVKLSKAPNDSSAAVIDIKKVKVLGRIIKNEFSI
ncbi:helix-turn-helix domain protein [Peptoclostridium acidaminophilum DSM 3953]|uniref:Helix-turn-helix domain protein n=1 Tax=Peptoclostridium acidaminophilum DSM 3953 TaxID=1286171 RepID=W8U527_PEPAC|nr:helix-turn-helix transcriptional regulator [Peptoclostridium acidaminophilum]AHM56061.1 helix-turn-helix domain protein [Peptoclostridium acidaminophilum DSM 3953]